MTAFMDEDFLLQGENGQHFYHDWAEKLPIIDYHCHIPPREICEDRRFENIAQVWLGGKQIAADGTVSYFGDHYKWRVMRSGGVSEEYITGDAPDKERFMRFAQVLPLAIGNPMYSWCHLELRRYFGYDGVLNGDTAQQVWDLCNDRLRHDPSFTVRGLIRSSGVAFIGTTDDPIDSLTYHKRLQADPDAPCVIAPSFRPDRALLIHEKGFPKYVEALSLAAQVPIVGIEDLLCALERRLDAFVRLGCRASDHGLSVIPSIPCTHEQADVLLRRAMSGQRPTQEEGLAYQSYLLTALARMYCQRGVAMQLHFSCQRNANRRMYQRLGADTGFDAIAVTDSVAGIGRLLDVLDREGQCPRTILYSLNRGDFDAIGALMGCFQGDELPGKIQLGSAWWFVDTKDGMEAQLRCLARLGLLGTFVGMLTDSRSFLSYTRHEYFRRILCNLLGEWVDSGQYPADHVALRTIVEGVCYKNAQRYFSL